jgi:hypothetical protein
MDAIYQLQMLERRIIRTRWWCAGCILFSLTIAILTAILFGDAFGTAMNYFAALMNHMSFERNGRTLRRVRETIEMIETRHREFERRNPA